MDNTPLITVITVCYNTETTITSTLRSVYDQNFLDYEYIVIDGGSTDRTVEILQRFEKRFYEKGVSFHIISEKDDGIYDAMNKGVNIATGKWLNFLNAGDYYVNSNVLLDFSRRILDRKDCIFYGDFVDSLFDLKKIQIAKPLSQIVDGMVFSHQSTFIARKLLVNSKYDESYKIAGDYNFFLKAYKAGIKYYYLEFPVAVFVRGGISSQGSDLVYLETAKARYENDIISEEMYESIAFELQEPSFKTRLKKITKKCIPKVLYEKYLRSKYIRMGYSAHGISE